MSEFNTHGGYFAPAGYMKVDAGGSHEENPNGGVQIGVDPQGVPNMLEEGEPVYNDYVFSDNIIVTKEMVEAHNLPKQIVGKLYSDAVQYFMDEAEERSFDSVSRNGLEAMLMRLADAQEEQKQLDAQKEIEDELSKMTPEELAELESMLPDAESQQVMPEEQVVPEQMAVPEEQMVQEEAPVEQVPPQQMAPVQMPMACGGKIARKFELGGDIPPARTLILDPNTGNYYAEGEAPSGVPFNVNPESGNFDVPVSYGGGIEPSVSVAYPGKSQAWVDAETSGIKKRVAEGSNQFVEDAYDVYKNNLGAQLATGAPGMIVSGVDDIAHGNYAEGAAELALGNANKLFNLAPAVAAGLGKYKAWRASKLLDKIKNLSEFASYESAGSAKGVEAQRKISKLSAEYDDLIRGLDDAAKTDAIKHLSDAKKVEQVARAADTGSGAAAPVAEAGANATTEVAPAAVENASKSRGRFWNVVEPGGYFLRNWQPKSFVGKTAKFIPRAAIDGAALTGEGWAIGKGIEAASNATGIGHEMEAYAEGGPMNVYYGGTHNLSRGPVGYRTSFVANDDSDRTYGWADWFKGGIHHMGNLLRAFRGVKESDERLGPNPPYYVGSKEQYYGVPGGEVLGPYFNGYGAVSEGEYLGPSKPASVGTRSGNGATTKPSAPAIKPRTGWIGNPAGFNQGKKGYVDLNKLVSNASATTNAGMKIVDDRESTSPLNSDVSGGSNSDWAVSSLPTFPMYSGAIGSGLLALQTALQNPDKYDLPHVAVQTPEGRIHLQNQKYNPIDYNMIANALLSQGNATARGLRNSGLGPSSTAAQVAADYNLGRNLGTGFIQTRDANNQQRNAVIAANNQAEAQRAQFDYGVDANRKQILNNAALYNHNLDLALQRLNNQAESEKYAAVSANLSNALQGLSNIGRQNFTMNQINSNRALYDYLFPNGVSAYKGVDNVASRGGLLLKYKK